MARTLTETLNETLSRETLSPEEQIASEEAAAPDLLTQPSALPALPTVDGKPLRFASPERGQTQETQTPKVGKSTNVYGDPAGKWFNYALLALLLLCAAASAVTLGSAVH